jgi:hypothetical protein
VISAAAGIGWGWHRRGAQSKVRQTAQVNQIASGVSHRGRRNPVSDDGQVFHEPLEILIEPRRSVPENRSNAA